ncbi:MAG TPA: glycosyltransferase family 2 protein [Thermoanaerobaculia bacterium]|nr:glycosyltransferase family 2 protein [Thermoanaerobaculia bacterium]
MMKVVAVIPAFNAARTLEPVVRGAREQLDTVVVVDDGSADGTAEVAARAGATVLKHEVNRGKGAALKTAFQWACGQDVDGIVTLDADGQHLPKEIPKFLACHGETRADLIIGGRAHLFGQMLPRRRMANRFSAWTIAIASGAKVTDSQSGYRFYSTRMLRDMHLHDDGFAMESEVIVRAGRYGFQVLTTPIDLGFVDGLSTSHYKPIADTIRIAVVVARTWLSCLVWRRRGR